MGFEPVITILWGNLIFSILIIVLLLYLGIKIIRYTFKIK